MFLLACTLMYLAISDRAGHSLFSFYHCFWASMGSKRSLVPCFWKRLTVIRVLTIMRLKMDFQQNDLENLIKNYEISHTVGMMELS